MPRCPDCNKFVSLDVDLEPEIDDVEVDGVDVSCSACIVNACGECGTELTEATLDLTGDVETEYVAHLAAAGVDVKADDFDPACVEGHALAADYNGDYARDQEGGGRYKKSHYTVDVTVELTCECGWKHDKTLSGKVAASEMDSLT